MRSWRLVWWVAVWVSVAGLGGGLGAEAAWAQPYTELRISPSQRLASAQLAMEDGRYREVVETLRPLVKTRPGFRTPERGTAAYMLGRAHALRGDSTQAHAAFRAGVNALTAQDVVAPRLFEASIESSLRDGAQDQGRFAVAAFLRLLGAAGPNASRIVRRHAARTLLLWPETERPKVTPDGEALFQGRGTLRPGAGAALQAWWRRHDPRPATPGNERIVEHLRRIRHAEATFGADTFLGFDDRGRVYVRLGAPDVRRSLSSRSIAKSVSGDTHFMPRNELWRYKGYGRHGHYLFVKGTAAYQEAGVLDLLPPPMRHGKTGTAALTALALRDFYDQLVPRVSEYAPLYDAMSDRVADLQMRSTLQLSSLTQMADTDMDPATGQSRSPAVGRPFLRDARRLEREVAEKRKQELPQAASEVTAAARTLPVAVRTARFLDGTGATETELYWSVRPHELQSDAVKRILSQKGYGRARQHLVQVRAQRHGMNYEATQSAEAQHRIRAPGPAQPREEPVFSMRLPGVREPHHLSVQWDHLVAPRRRSADAVRVQTNVHWADSVQALPRDDETLALSDLVPVQPGTYDPSRPLRTVDGWTAVPIPFRRIDPNGEVGLYLEVYHLAAGTDGQRHYTVEYAVTKTDVATSRLGKIFRGDRSETTAASTTRTTRVATAREYLEIRLGDRANLAGADTITLAVQVIDETTGQTAQRTLVFEAAD